MRLFLVVIANNSSWTARAVFCHPATSANARVTLARPFIRSDLFIGRLLNGDPGYWDTTVKPRTRMLSPGWPMSPTSVTAPVALFTVYTFAAGSLLTAGDAKNMTPTP